MGKGQEGSCGGVVVQRPDGTSYVTVTVCGSVFVVIFLNACFRLI